MYNLKNKWVKYLLMLFKKEFLIIGCLEFGSTTITVQKYKYLSYPILKLLLITLNFAEDTLITLTIIKSDNKLKNKQLEHYITMNSTEGQ